MVHFAWQNESRLGFYTIYISKIECFTCHTGASSVETCAKAVLETVLN